MRNRALAAGLAILAGMALPAITAVPAIAQLTPVPNPAFDAAKAAADAQGATETAAIQRLLILTGDLNALASGEYGKRTFDAIKAAQTRLGAPPTGILLPAERKKLQSAADKVVATYGLKTISDNGISVLYPSKVATKRTPGKHGPKFSAADGSVTVDLLAYPADEEEFSALFERLKKPRAGRTIAYSLIKPEFFVISGNSDGASFYMRFLAGSAGTKGFVVGWNPKLSPGFDRIPIAMASSLAVEGQLLAPVDNKGPASAATVSDAPAEPPKPAGPPLPFKPGVTYAARDGLGVIVSAAGDVLTTADLATGCESLLLPDGGKAQVVGGDPNNNVALARLLGPVGGSVAVNAAAPAAGAALVATALAADGAVSRADAAVAAITGPKTDTRRFIATGPGGDGFLFDAAGSLVSLRIAADPASASNAVALQPLFLSAFLRANGVAATGPASGDPAKAIVKLRCDKTQG